MTLIAVNISLVFKSINNFLIFVYNYYIGLHDHSRSIDIGYQQLAVSSNEQGSHFLIQFYEYYNYMKLNLNLI